VDKVLICGAFIFLLPAAMSPGEEEHWLLPWMVTLIVARELIITSLRSFMENQGGSFGADWLGKIKMGCNVPPSSRFSSSCMHGRPILTTARPYGCSPGYGMVSSGQRSLQRRSRGCNTSCAPINSTRVTRIRKGFSAKYAGKKM